MKQSVVAIVLIGLVAAPSTNVEARTIKRIHGAIAKSRKKIRSACGCDVSFRYSKRLDFTNAYGSDMMYNIQRQVEDIGSAVARYCKKGGPWKAKLCRLVHSVTISETKLSNPYTEHRGADLVSYVCTKNPKQLMHHSAIWLRPYMTTGKMPKKPSS
ncbi:MAG: hypothetical protein KC503_27760 [Myxococcales bacterium]|nr:hypothetical protein [Myxococcales bacterium]